MQRKSFHTFVILAGIALALPLTFKVAVAVVIPPSAESGVVTQGLGGKERPPSSIEAPVPIPKMDEITGKASTGKVFVLKSVVLDHSTVYTSESFKSIYKEYLGEKVSFADLNTIAHDMTRQYRNDGYVFSRVIITPQKIANGVVHFQAVEGRIANVSIVGTFKDDHGVIRRMANKIMSSGPANTKVIERYLLLINDLPGVKARSFIKPSKTVGAGDLVIDTEEKKLEGSISFDDRGSKPLGPFRGQAVGAINDAFGIHDRTTVRGISASQTQELRYGEITHEEQLGSEGFRLKGRFASTDTAPGGNISNLAIKGYTSLFDLEGLYPVVRGRQMNINLITSFNLLNSSTDVAGINVSKDRVRHVRAAGHLDFTDSLRGVNQFDLELTHGLKALNATDDGIGRSRANGEHDFMRANLTATRIQELWGDWSLYLSATGQASNDPLLASEEFTVGGESYGRAYDSGEIAGDKGYAGVGEIRYGQLIQGDLVKSYQLYAFLDSGRVINIDPAVGENGTASLTSTGGGVRFNLAHDFLGYLEADVPLTRQVASENNNATRIFLSLLKRF
ncbi:MAG: ShlB/FhaC/HecB family hemolysin secretion/activation protein [Proteobacteria bacterium]|nr:ShlB/FhaC/HecB family hemolysin secretion/activation protein [Pseudomonadota bacterium]